MNRDQGIRRSAQELSVFNEGCLMAIELCYLLSRKLKGFAARIEAFNTTTFSNTETN